MALLRELLEAHETLIERVRAHRDAMTSADPAAMQEALERQAEAVRAIGDLDSARATLAQKLIQSDPGLRAQDMRGSTPTLREIARTIPEPSRTTALNLAEKLRARIETARTNQASNAIAAQALATHMAGLVRLVERRLDAGGSYASLVKGARSQAGTPLAARALDLTQ